MEQILAQLSGFWRGLGGAQRIAFVAIALIVSGALALLVSLAGRPQYATLFANLEPADASKVVDALSSQLVPYRLTHAGTAIQVPVERVYDLRLELASQGVPASGTIGFEAFDQTSLGSTPFQERVRFRRALEGELARTISQLDPVHWTRVHINLPDRKVFLRDSAKASASVVVSLRSGQALSGTEVQGIGHLVAGAVEGLSVDQVTIVDTRGRLLARAGSGDDEDLMAAEVLDVQRALERRLSTRAQELLDAAFGSGTSVVTVSASLDRRRVEEDQDRVNPDEAAVLSEQTTEETRTEPGASVSGGVAGAAANVPGGTGQESSGGGTAREEITRTTTNFEVSRTRSRTVKPMGEIERLSVAVLVDGTYAAPAAAPGEEPAATPPERTYQPRSPEEIAQITEIVKRAVGFSDRRGDEIEVQNLPFHAPLEDVAAPAPDFWERPELLTLLPGLSRAFAVLLGICLLIFLVIRPALKQLTLANIVRASAAAGMPVAPGETGPAGEPLAKLVSEAEKLRRQLASENPRLVADAMKQWLRE